MSKLVTRRMRVRRNKYTKRKGYRKYKKHYTRKNAKRIQNKKRLRRQTRRKRGGEEVIGVVPEDKLYVDLELPKVKPQDVDRDPLANAAAEAQQMDTSAEAQQMDTSAEANAAVESNAAAEAKAAAEANAAAEAQQMDTSVESNAAAEAKAVLVKQNTKEQPTKAFLIGKENFEKDLTEFRESLKPKPPQIVSQDNLTTEHIKFMLKKIEEYSKNKQTCLLLCDPDSCDENMLEKIKAKFIANAEDNHIDLDQINLEQDYGVLSDILGDSLLLILENLCNEYEKPKESSNFTFSMLNCSSRILKLFKGDDKLHSILKIFFMSIVKNNRTTLLSVCVSNMKKILDLLNSITMSPKSMEKLLYLLNSMSTENMQKLLSLLKSITPENMQLILDNVNKYFIKNIVENYTELNQNPEFLEQLLELYSFIERTQSGDFLVHRYKDGKTPLLQRFIRNNEHRQKICKAVDELNKEVNTINDDSRLNNSKLKINKDKEFELVLDECKKSTPTPRQIIPQNPVKVVSGGGRKTRTLKKKRGSHTRRKRMVK